MYSHQVKEDHCQGPQTSYVSLLHKGKGNAILILRKLLSRISLCPIIFGYTPKCYTVIRSCFELYVNGLSVFFVCLVSFPEH